MTVRLSSHAAQRDVPEKELVSVCRKLAARLGCHMELISQRGGRHSGTSCGAPDALLYVSGRCVPLEFKTASGRLSQPQINAYAQRLACGVETAIVRSLEDFVGVVNAARRA